MTDSLEVAFAAATSRRKRPYALLGALCALLVGSAMAGQGPMPTPDVAAPDQSSGCEVEVRKSAEPAAAWLGGEVEVRLAANVRCANAAPLHAALLMDTSLDMGGARMAHARESVLAFADTIDAETSQVALISYSAVVDVLTPLTGDRDALLVAAERLFPRRGSDLAAALVVARRLLEGARDDPGGSSLDAIVLLSASAYDSRPADVLSAAQAAKDAGIAISVVAYGGNADVPTLERVASSPDRLYVEGLSSRLPSLYRQIAGDLTVVRPVAAEVVDVLPSNMWFVWGSAVPAPRTRDRELTWNYAVWPEAGVDIVYAVEPRQVGRLATNERASISVRFDRGAPVVRSFPVPFVEVSDAPSPTTSVPPTALPTPVPTDAVTETPTPGGPTTTPARPVWLPAVFG